MVVPACTTCPIRLSCLSAPGIPATLSVVEARGGTSSVTLFAACMCSVFLLATATKMEERPTAESHMGSGLVLQRQFFDHHLVIGQLSGVESLVL